MNNYILFPKLYFTDVAEIQKCACLIIASTSTLIVDLCKQIRSVRDRMQGSVFNGGSLF